MNKQATPPNRSFAAAIREERERCGLSQTLAAERLKTKLRTWQDWEKGIAEPPDYARPLILRELAAWKAATN